MQFPQVSPGIMDKSEKSAKSEKPDWTHSTAEAVANLVVCLVHQATYLLGRQIARLEQDFLLEGGITERLYRTRQRARYR